MKLTPLNNSTESSPALSHDIRMHSVIMTPKDAAAFRNTHHNFRKLNPNTVSKYARQMRKGMWFLSTLTFDDSGNLCDGQHRLAAVEQYGAPIEFLVLSNWPSKWVAVIDTGVSRTAGQIMTHDDRVRFGGNTVAALTRALVVGSSMTVCRLAPQELCNLADHFQSQIADVLGPIQKARHARVAPVQAVVLRALICHPEMREVIQRGWRYFIASSLPTAACDGFGCFLKSFREGKYADRNRTTSAKMYSHFSNALQHYMENKPCSRLTTTKNDLFPAERYADFQAIACDDSSLA